MASLVIVLICCFSSDLQNERPKHIMVMAAIATISLIITAAVNNSKARYAFLTFGNRLPGQVQLHLLIYHNRRCWNLVLQSVDAELLVQYDLPTSRKASRGDRSSKVRTVVTSIFIYQLTRTDTFIVLWPISLLYSKFTAYDSHYIMSRCLYAFFPLAVDRIFGRQTMLPSILPDSR